MKNKLILNRNKIINPSLIGKTILTYNGKTFHEIKISFEMLNYKIGQFSLTKKKVVHKIKKKT